MRLALSENRITKWKELRHELTPTELTDLIAYSSVEPWGDRRADIRQAFMTALILQATNGHEVEIDKIANYLGDQSSDAVESSEFQSPNCAAAMAAQHYPSTIK